MGALGGLLLWSCIFVTSSMGAAGVFILSGKSKYPDRYSETFASGRTSFGRGGCYPIFPRGYVYECRDQNGMISRCPEMYTTMTQGGENSRGDLQEAIVVKQGPEYMTYENGFVFINNLSTPMMWNDRVYFWDRTFYREPENTTVCKFQIEYDDATFKNLRIKDTGNKPREIVWGCPMMEFCCGYTCCEPKNVEAAWMFFPLMVMLLFLLVVLRCLGRYQKKRDAAAAENETTELSTMNQDPPQASSLSAAPTPPSQKPEGRVLSDSVFCPTSDLPIEFLEDQPGQPPHSTPGMSESRPPSEFSTGSRRRLLRNNRIDSTCSIQ